MRKLIQRRMAGWLSRVVAGQTGEHPGIGTTLERLESRSLLSSSLPTETTTPDDPARSGESGVIVTLNDGEAPDSAVDLSGVISDKLKLPTTQVTSGNGAKLSIPLILTNNGSEDVPAGLTVIARVIARQVGEESGTPVGDVVLKVGGLKAGASKPYALPFTLPTGLATGSYIFDVQIDATGQLAEINEDNNTATTPEVAAVSVARGFVDVAIASVLPTVPPGVVSGVGAKGKVAVTLNNAGNVPLPKGQQVLVEVLLHPDGAEDSTGDILIGSVPALAVSALKGGASKKANVNVIVADTTPEGEYDLVVRVTPVQAVTEESLANNTALPNASVVVADPFVDLSGTVSAKLKLPTVPVTSGAGAKLAIPADVRNNGNVPIAAGVTVTAQVIARLVGEETGAVVGEAPLKVGGIKPGLAKPFTVPFLLPPGLASGDYEFDVKLDSALQLTESNENNNIATTPNGTTLDVLRGYVDIVPSLVSSTLPIAVVAGSGGGGKVVVQLSNAGNVPLPADQQANVDVLLHPTDAEAGDSSGDRVIGTLSNFALGGLKPNTNKSASINAIIGADVPTDGYTVVIRVTPVPALSEESVANNTLITNGVVDVAGANIQVGFETATTSFGVAAQGASSGSGIVTLHNDGNIPATGTLDITFVAKLVSDPSQVVSLGQRAAVAINLAAGAVGSTINVPLTLPAVLDDPVNYTIEAIITNTTLNLPNGPGGDIFAVGALTVTPAPPGGAALIGTVTFTQTQILDQTINVFGNRVGQVVSLGTFTTQAGRTGGYTWSLPFGLPQAGVNDEGFMILTFDGSPSLIINQLHLFFDGARPESLQGRSIQFVEGNAGSSGDYETAGSVIYKGAIYNIDGSFNLT